MNGVRPDGLRRGSDISDPSWSREPDPESVVAVARLYDVANADSSDQPRGIAAHT